VRIRARGKDEADTLLWATPAQKGDRMASFDHDVVVIGSGFPEQV
jgi:hypothetical protein